MPPTSSRTFDEKRNQTVTSRGEPLIADFKLPELEDLKNIRRRTGPQQQARGIEQAPLGQSAPEQEYDYEGVYVQPDTYGGYSNWTPGMGFGMRTQPAARGWRRVARPGSGVPKGRGGIGG